MSSTSGSWLIAAIEGAQESHGTGRDDPGFFHPSSFGNECDAYLAFRYLGAPAVSVVVPKLQRIFDDGNFRDERLKTYCAKAGISLCKPYPTPITCPKCGLKNIKDNRHVCIPHLHIRGELDDWVENPVTKEQFVIDYKGMRDDYWKELTEVTHPHHLQLHPYMYDRETYKGYLIYENKNNQDIKPMVANFDGKIWKVEIQDRIERIIEGLDKGYVYRTPTSCSGCPFFANGVCTSNQIEKLKEQSGLF